MAKHREEICRCMGTGIQSPSLRALIVIVDRAEAKRAEAEARLPAADPVPTNEQRERLAPSIDPKASDASSSTAFSGA